MVVCMLPRLCDAPKNMASFPRRCMRQNPAVDVKRKPGIQFTAGCFIRDADLLWLYAANPKPLFRAGERAEAGPPLLWADDGDGVRPVDLGAVQRATDLRVAADALT